MTNTTKVADVLAKIEQFGAISRKDATDILGYSVSSLIRSGMLETYDEPNPLHYLGGRGVKLMRSMVRRTSKPYDPLARTKNLRPPRIGEGVKFEEKLKSWAQKNDFAILSPAQKAEFANFADATELATALQKMADTRTTGESKYILLEAATHIIGMQKLVNSITGSTK